MRPHPPQLAFVFLIGLPGAGKSFSFSLLRELCEGFVRERGFPRFSVTKVDDYIELNYLSLVEAQTMRRYFGTASNKETFAVVNPEVYKVVLRNLNAKLVNDPLPPGLRFIEFSRDEYVDAFDCFSLGLLRRAAVLDIDCDLDECIERNEARGRALDRGGYDPRDMDVHYVPLEVMKRFYGDAESRRDYRDYYRGLPFLRYDEVSSTGDREAFVARLREYFETGLKPLVLDRL